MNAGVITALNVVPVPRPASRPVKFRSDGSAAAAHRADVDQLFADGKIADYLSGDRERTAKAHAGLMYCFFTIGSTASFVGRCVADGMYQDPRIAQVLKHLIEGFVGTDERALLLQQTRRLKTRAHPDKTGALLDGITDKQKAIVAKRVWRLYNAILDFVSNKEVLGALYGAADRAHEQDLYEGPTSALRRWLRQPGRNPLAPWKELTAAAVAVAIGIAFGVANQVLLGNPVTACLAGAAAGSVTHLALRRFLG